MTASFALGLRAVVLMVGPAQHADRLLAFPRLRLGKTDMRKLGLGERDPWNEIIVGFGAQAKQRVSDHDARMVVRCMGELRPTSHVADCVNLAVRRL